MLVFYLAVGLAAQEIVDFRVSQDNERYKIQLGSSVSRFNIRADLYVFYRLRNTTTWYKARTLLGRYLNITNSNIEEQLYWDPVFDFQPWGEYEFKLYLVNLAAVNPGYDYNQTNSVGLLSPIDINTSYGTEVNGHRFYTNTGPIALPAGSYNVSLFDGSVSLARKSVNVEAFGNSSISREELVGTLNIVCNNPAILISAGTTQLRADAGMGFPVGMMSILATLPQKSVVYPAITRTYDVVIRAGEPTNLWIDIPAGRLMIKSDLEGGSYSIDGNKYVLVDGMLLSPGRYEIHAHNRNGETRDTFTVNIVDGETTTISVVSDRITFLLSELEFFGAYEGYAEEERPEALAVCAAGLINYTGFAGNGNVNLLYSLGLLDRVYVPWDIDMERVSPSYDIFSIGGGFRFSSFQKTLNLDLIGSYRWGVRYPLTTKFVLNGISCRYIHRFDEYDNDDGSKGRSTSTADFYNGLEARAELRLRLGADWDVYLYGVLQDQDPYEGDWYFRSEVNAWRNFETDTKPNPTHHPGLPSRIASLEGTTLRFGIGFRYNLWNI